MASSLANYASRVLSMDQESNSFVPIIGLNKTDNMKISESMMHAWNGCPQLRAAVDEDDMEAIVSGALLHFRNLSSPDPHDISEDEAASAHVYTQETRFFRQLNEHLRGTDRSKIEPYKPYAFPCDPFLKNKTHRPFHSLATFQLLETPPHRPAQDPPLRQHFVPRRGQTARAAATEIRKGKIGGVVGGYEHRIPRQRAGEPDVHGQERPALPLHHQSHFSA